MQNFKQIATAYEEKTTVTVNWKHYLFLACVAGCQICSSASATLLMAFQTLSHNDGNYWESHTDTPK